MAQKLAHFIPQNGMTIPCNYLLHDAKSGVASASMWAMHGFAMDNRTPDHIPLQASFVFITTRLAPVARRGKPEYDRRAVRDAFDSQEPSVLLKVKQLDDHLQAMLPIPVDVEPTTHRHLLAHHTLEGLRCYFPIPLLERKKEWVSDNTFNLVDIHASVKHAHGNIGNKLKRDC